MEFNQQNVQAVKEKYGTASNFLANVKKYGLAATLSAAAVSSNAAIDVSAPIASFFSSRRRHTRLVSDWSSDVCSSDLKKREQTCALPI